jgi:putative ABC transport system permease protein
VDNLLKDIAYGIRTLRKSPGFTITALITLALGIGASTSIFSVVDSVLLRPLPYADADRLMIINSELRNRNVHDFPFPPADIADLRQQVTSMQSVAGVASFPQPLVSEGADPEQVQTGFVTANLISTLGTPLELGRDFTDAEAAPPPKPSAAVQAGTAAPPPIDGAVIHTHGFWKRRFGGDPNVIGRTVQLGGNNAHVVGVLAPNFELLLPPRFQVQRVPDLLQLARVDFENGSRINVIFFLVGRLKPGATLATARAQLDALGVDERKRFPINETAGVYYSVLPMRAELSTDVRPALLALMGAVAFVLLIACANVANLILVRTSRRERELAVRAAFGGSRARLVRQMLVEALVLSAGGALLGLGVAKLGVVALMAVGPQNLPSIGAIGLSTTVLGFAVFAAIVAASLFGIVPAVRASRPNVMGILRRSGRTSELGGGRVLRNAVVVAEVTLAFVLLIGGGLMFRSFLAITDTDPGFDPHGVLTFAVANPNTNTNDARAAYQRALHDQLAAIPGVSAVTAGVQAPFSGNVPSARYGFDAALKDPSTFRQSNLGIVDPGYFAAMRTPILEGRDFTEAENTPKSQAVVVDSLFAAKAWPGQSALGKRFLMRARTDTVEWMDVIGVVRHERFESLSSIGREMVFMVNGQFGFGAGGTWFVRTAGDPALLVPQVRTLESYVGDARSSTRFALVLIGTFAAIAVVLAAIGLYGVLSTVVRQRTAEIGVRMALGARLPQVAGLVLGESLRLAGIGVAIGLVAAFAGTRLLRSLLFDVSPTDPLVLAVTAVVLVVIAAAASLAPTRRAAQIDPVEAMRT